MSPNPSRDRPFKLGIVTTHPIQYKIPWYRALHAHPRVDLTVFYAMLPTPAQQGEGFGVAFEWDIPLLDGYHYEVLDNVARQPSIVRFSGCDTPGIRDVVRRGAFDAFLVNGWVVKSCVQTLRSCRKHGVPCLVRGEANALRPRVWWKRLGHRWLLRQFSAFLSIGEANKQFYLSHGVSEDCIFFAPYCVDNARFARVAEDMRGERESIRQKWGIPGGAFVFLFCAKFEEKKRPLDLLEAAARAMGKHGVEKDKAHILMVGDGALKPLCEETAQRLGLPVAFTGFLNQTEIVQAYVASDCLVLPSDHGETWGLVVNEAMACGLPAIVSDRVGCHLDLVLPGKTGAVFPFGARDALAEQLAGFASRPEASQGMGRLARAQVAKYSIEQVVQATVDALEYVCGTRD